MTEPLLAIEHLSAFSDRGRAPVLRGVSLTVASGEVHGLVGESGAGKSTVARAVLGILPRTIRITGGSVMLSGTELLTLDPRRRRRLAGQVALIPQDPLSSLNPSRRVGSQLMDGLRMWKGCSPREARRRALLLLQEVQMPEPERVLRCYPHELSGGMRQRVLIAAAFALEPKLVIADEPTTALDVTVQKQVLILIRDMQVRHGTGAVFVTHDLGVVAQVCDRVSLLFDGRMVEQGSTDAFFSNPRHPYTQALLRAAPRYDEPEQQLIAVPDAVLAACRAETKAFDKIGALG